MAGSYWGPKRDGLTDLLLSVIRPAILSARSAKPGDRA